MGDLDKEKMMASQAIEKKHKDGEKIIGEWKQKNEELYLELDKVQNDARMMTGDISRLKSQLEETTDSLEAYKRDCKKMNEEIIGLQEELDERNAKVVDLDKALKNEC